MFNFRVSPLAQNNVYPLNRLKSPAFSGNSHQSDVLDIKKVSIVDKSENIDKETMKEIVQAISEIDFKNDKPLGIGADGNAFRISLPNSDLELVAKASHAEDKNPKTGEMQRVGETFEKEREMLKKAGRANENSQEYIASLKMGGRNILVSTLVKGKSPSFPSNPLNQENLGSILQALNTLDEKGVLHRDLKKENVFVDKTSAGLLDYGVSIDINLTDFDHNVNENHFAPFEMPTNLKSFEATMLMPYLNEMGKSSPIKAKELYRQYLALRAENVHRPAAQRLREYAQSNDLSENEIDKINEMAHYQELSAKVLSNPTKTVSGVEFLKGQISYNSELAYKNEILLLNPLANVSLKFNALMAAKKLEKSTNELLKKPQNADVREYLQYQNEFAIYQLNKISGWTRGLTDWLLNCLTTPIDEAKDYQMPVIEQMTSDDLNEFEIPNHKL